MSKSSAPTAATPRMPSVARAGWRTRLRQAKPSVPRLVLSTPSGRPGAFIGEQASGRCAAAAPTMRLPWPLRREAPQ